MNFIEEELIDIKRLDLSLYFSVRQMLTKVLQDSIKDKQNLWKTAFKKSEETWSA